MPDTISQQRACAARHPRVLVAAVIVARRAVLASYAPVVGARRAGAIPSKGPEVQVVRATASAGMPTITVLADVTPYQQATLYAKVSGYLAKVLVDKGDM